MEDESIVSGISINNSHRVKFERELYQKYQYFIQEGCKKYRLSYEDSFSAYTDAVLSFIQNVINGRFENRVTIKTYLFQIFRNKCVDLIRKITNNKEKVNQFPTSTELLYNTPDGVKTAIEKIIDQEKIARIRQLLDEIGEKCREILLLHEDGYTDQEISEKLTYNTAAVVKTTRLRCREKLKNLFISHDRF